MRFKKLLPPILFCVGIVTGLILGWLFTTMYQAKLFVDTATMLSEGEIATANEAAFQAYLTESPDTGIWALTRLIEILQDYSDEEPHVLILKTDVEFYLIVAHARLAKLYTKKGQPDLAKKETQKALSIARAADPRLAKELKTGEDLISFVSKIDEKEKGANNEIQPTSRGSAPPSG